MFYVGEDHRAWNEHLDEFQYAINSAKHESTRYSSGILNLGRELPSPTDRLKDQSKIPDLTAPLIEPWRSRMTRLSVIRDLMIRHLEEASDRQGHYYNEGRREVVLGEGDRVMKRHHILSSAADFRAAKLAPRFDGPYVVSKVLSPVEYQLSDTSGAVIGSFHVSDLKPYRPEVTEEEVPEISEFPDAPGDHIQGDGTSGVPAVPPSNPCQVPRRSVNSPPVVTRQEDRPRRGRPPPDPGARGTRAAPDLSPRRLRSANDTGRQLRGRTLPGPQEKPRPRLRGREPGRPLG